MISTQLVLIIFQQIQNVQVITIQIRKRCMTNALIDSDFNWFNVELVYSVCENTTNQNERQIRILEISI